MPEKRSIDGIRISNSSFVAGNIGGSGNRGSVFQRGDADGQELGRVLEQLRDELARLREMLPATEGPEAQPGDVDDVIACLDSIEPDIEQAEGRWKRLWSRIPESLRTLNTVNTIVNLLTEVRGLVG